METEKELIFRAQHQDEAAFTRLYEIYFYKIYNFLFLKLGNQADAEDLTQQVFLKAYLSLSSFRWINIPFSAYLFTIARNLSINFLKKKHKNSLVTLNESLLYSSSVNKREESLDNHEKLGVSLDCLTDLQREVIYLRFTAGLTTNEIARIMGKSEGAIKNLQFKALQMLRKVMIKNDKEK